LDSGDNPHITYFDNANIALNYAYWASDKWNFQVIDTDAGLYTSLILDEEDEPHIAYYHSYGSDGDLRYAELRDGLWNYETADSIGDVGTYASLALDAVEKVHIAYYDASNDDLKYTLGDPYTPPVWASIFYLPLTLRNR
jgi:hypothetical protein